MKDISTILIVDDLRSNIIAITLLFKQCKECNSYRIVTAESGQEALEMTRRHKVDLILLDIMMPQMDGYEVCKHLKANDETKNIPIIFITGHSDDASLEKAYEAGASDYVTKPFRAVELLARVKINLQLYRTINALEHMANYDIMTDIYNRRKFFELAIPMFEECRDDLYAVMLDIDKFKSINDAYGHAVGDMVIKQVAKILKEKTDKEMLLARIGGEEFVLLLYSNSDDEVVTIVESIRKSIEAMEIVVKENQTLHCTISSGIARYTYTMPTIDYLLEKADYALYEAKNSGRNKSIFRV